VLFPEHWRRNYERPLSLDVCRDIIIGLRSDGTVVWKSLGPEIESETSNLNHLPDEE